MLRTATRDFDLGPTLDVSRALGEIGKVAPANEFAELHGLMHAEDGTAAGWYVVEVASQARTVTDRYGDHLSARARAFLAVLSECATDTEVAIGSAVKEAARMLGARTDAAKLTEKDLEVAFRAALEAEPALSAVRTQGSVTLRTWPRVGCVDVVAAGAEGRVACELKWWSTSAGRYQTLWDLTKLGSLLREGAFELAFLLSGASPAVWALDDDHTRVFDDGRHDVSQLCTISTNWWTSPVHSETVVPALIETAGTGRASLDVNGSAFELRAARLVANEGLWQVPARVRSVP